MADTIDDVSDFPTPPRHPEDIKAELRKLSNAATDAIFEDGIFDEYATKFPAEFAFQMGETVCFLTNPGRIIRAKLLGGFDSATEDVLGDTPEE